MELKCLKCTNCGAIIDPDTVNYASRTAKCPACDTKFIIEQAQNFARVEVDKTKDIKNYRQNLSRAIDFNDAPAILRYAQLILDILPEDFEANYFFAYGKAKCEDDDRHLYVFLDDDAQDCTDEAQERVANHLIKYGNVRDEKRIIRFIKGMGDSSERYLALYRKEFEKKAAEEELYDDITRDVFICHRSTNGEVARRIVRELERDGNTCWISSRNLRPNDNENYWDNIRRAVKSCRIFLVVSSRDAMISADVKKEIAFAKDLNKKRLEVKIDDSEHTMLFKDFFDGCKWIKGENYSEIKWRVSDLLMQELSGAKKADIQIKTQNDSSQTAASYPEVKKHVADLMEKEYSNRSYAKATMSPPRQNAVEDFNQRYSQTKNDRERIALVRSFPLPQSGEELMDFCNLAAINIDEKIFRFKFLFARKKEGPSLKALNDAWLFKLTQIHLQANKTLKGTAEYKEIEDIYFTKSREVDKYKKVSLTIKIVIAVVAFYVFFMAFALIFSACGGAERLASYSNSLDSDLERRKKEIQEQLDSMSFSIEPTEELYIIEPAGTGSRIY